MSAVQDYLIEEVQKTYQMQGVDINDKHIEVIVRQMLKKVRLVDAGDTGLVAGGLVEKAEVIEANNVIDERIAEGEEGLRKASWVPKFWESPRQPATPTPSCLLLPSRRPPKSSPMLPLRVRAIPWWASRKMLSLVS